MKGNWNCLFSATVSPSVISWGCCTICPLVIYDGRNRFAILLSIRVLIRREISRLLTVFNFRVDRSLGSKELESAREGERDERTERKRARTDGTMVVLPDVVDTMATGTSLRVESRVGSHWHFKMSASPLAMHCLSFRLPASRLWTISVSVLRGFVERLKFASWSSFSLWPRCDVKFESSRGYNNRYLFFLFFNRRIQIYRHKFSLEEMICSIAS